MPILIKLMFPAGRYHATPWGRHVNEGVVEWPPSPWRLLRALVAVWKRTCLDIDEPTIRRILEALSAPPRFNLPPHRVAHTRHAMPMNILQRMYKPSAAEKKAGKYQGDPSIIFDTFVCIDRSTPLYVGWSDAQLEVDDRNALSRLLGNLSSLGRAESWVEAELSSDDIELDLGQASCNDPDPVRVLCPDPKTAFSDEHYPKLDPTKLAKGKVKASDYLFDCPRWHLCLDTETIHGERWPMAPGSKWINYHRPAEGRAVYQPRVAQRSSEPTTTAIFLLDGPVLPLVKNTVQVAEAFRRALMSVFGNCCAAWAEAVQYVRPGTDRYASPTFSGKDRDGKRVLGHAHAHFLPIPDRCDPRRVRELVVYAPSGFQPLEVAALRRLRDVTFDGLACRTQLVGLAGKESLGVSLHGPSTTWVSLTPFIAHRHAKGRGRRRDVPLDSNDSRSSFLMLAAHEICAKHGLPLVEATPVTAAATRLRFHEFRRQRSRFGNDAFTRTAGYMRLTFAKQIDGPLCLGYNSHFGMGMFVSEGTAGPTV